MVEQARLHVQEHLGGGMDFLGLWIINKLNALDCAANTSQFEFVQSSAEQLDFLENESVDLIISGEAHIQKQCIHLLSLV